MATVVQERIQFDSLSPWTGTYLNLDAPKTITKSPNEKPKFSANFEIDKDHPEVARVRAEIVAAARAKWPNMDIGAAIKEGRLNVPLSDGDKLADKAKQKSADTGKQKLREWSRGKMVLIARSEFPAAVNIRENGIVIPLDDLAAVARAKNKFFYYGVQCLFGVRFNAYEAIGADGKPGVNAYLDAVESLGFGERLIAQKDRTERFKGYIGLEKAEDPTGADASSDW